MKPIILLVVFNLLMHSYASAQRYKHEFGIGPGYLELSKDRYDFIEGESNSPTPAFRKQSQLAFTSYQDGYSTYSNRYYRINRTLPAFYYSFVLQKRLQFRASFQASFAKTLFDHGSFSATSDVNTIQKVRKYDINFGFNYNYLNVHTIKLSVGLGFNLNPLVEKSTEYFRGIKTQTNNDLYGTMRVVSSLGICIPYNRRTNFNYELAVLKDEITIFIRPMSRLSLSYLF